MDYLLGVVIVCFVPSYKANKSALLVRRLEGQVAARHRGGIAALSLPSLGSEGQVCLREEPERVLAPSMALQGRGARIPSQKAAEFRPTRQMFDRASQFFVAARFDHPSGVPMT
jgi:hypothetical protein